MPTVIASLPSTTDATRGLSVQYKVTHAPPSTLRRPSYAHLLFSDLSGSWKKLEMEDDFCYCEALLDEKEEKADGETLQEVEGQAASMAPGAPKRPLSVDDGSSADNGPAAKKQKKV